MCVSVSPSPCMDSYLGRYSLRYLYLSIFLAYSSRECARSKGHARRKYYCPAKPAYLRCGAVPFWLRKQLIPALSRYYLSWQA